MTGLNGEKDRVCTRAVSTRTHLISSRVHIHPKNLRVASIAVGGEEAAAGLAVAHVINMWRRNASPIPKRKLSRVKLVSGDVPVSNEHFIAQRKHLVRILRSTTSGSRSRAHDSEARSRCSRANAHRRGANGTVAELRLPAQSRSHSLADWGAGEHHPAESRTLVQSSRICTEDMRIRVRVTHGLLQIVGELGEVIWHRKGPDKRSRSRRRRARGAPRPRRRHHLRASSASLSRYLLMFAAERLR